VLIRATCNENLARSTDGDSHLILKYVTVNAETTDTVLGAGFGPRGPENVAET